MSYEVNPKTAETIAKVVEDFSDLVNSFSFGKEERKKFFQEFCRQHRTLQQSMFRVILSLIVNMASDEYHTDGRNEYSKKMAKTLVAGYAEQYKQDYLDAEPGRRGNKYYEERAEEYKQGIIKNPADYFGVPCI